MSKYRSRPSLADLTRFCAPRGGRFAVGRFTGDVARPATGRTVRPRDGTRHVLFCPSSGNLVGCASGAVEATDGETNVVTCKRCILSYLDGGFRRRGEAPWWETAFVPLERVS